MAGSTLRIGTIEFPETTSSVVVFIVVVVVDSGLSSSRFVVTDFTESTAGHFEDSVHSHEQKSVLDFRKKSVDSSPPSMNSEPPFARTR